MQRKRASTECSFGKYFDASGCPFREFKDNELGADLWGLGPEAVLHRLSSKPKSSVCDNVWDDDQIQPLPRSVRKNFHEWIRAEELAGRWEATVVVSRDSMGTENNNMRSHEVQSIYSYVLQRSSFCRKVLSCCYLLERVENCIVEHQWENFTCAVGPDGWLPRLHILSPGMKPGGGSLHKPSLSKSGCYLVRLYFLGAWRCVWVSDLVPLDERENPLLPFAQPTCAPVPTGKNMKPQPVSTPVVQLWPLLLCKALLKLAALDMFDNEGDCDEPMQHLHIMHCLTGAFSLQFKFREEESLWSFMNKEAAVFAWDDSPVESPAATTRGKSVKKPAVKNTSDVLRRKSVVCVELMDTLGVPSYELPGLTPAYELNLLAQMMRDLPLVRPPNEPEVPLWKTFRWVKWARGHGLYDDYECPRKRWMKAIGLLRLSHCPHLLDVKSTESISNTHAKELDKTRKRSDTTTVSKSSAQPSIPGQTAENMEWIDFHRLYNYVKQLNVLYLPSMHQYFSVGNALSPRLPTKTAQVKLTDLQAPTNAPLYLQVDSKERINFLISLSSIHPNILRNSGYPLKDYVKPAHLILEKFVWLSDEKNPINASAYLQTRSYDALEMNLPPGRHVFRLWVTSALAWNCCILSEACLNLCKRNIAFSLANAECPWATQKLSGIYSSFESWIKGLPVRNLSLSRLFYKSYAPDLYWNPNTVGYLQTDIHWMFRQALSKFLQGRFPPDVLNMICATLRCAFLDPYFGLNEPPGASLETLEVFRNACDISRAKCFCENSLNLNTPESEIQDTVASSLNDENIDDLRKFVVDTKLSSDCIHCDSIIIKVQNILLKHEAATVIQSNWRRIRCQRMYKNHSIFYPDVIKMILDQVCSTTGVSALMDTFFKLFPEVRSAYSISTALGGLYGYQQYPGVSVTTPKDVWIPLFIGTFYCHSSVRVHFDLECILRKCSVVIIDNDTRTEVPIAVNSHMTYDFNPNMNGYDVHAHAWRTSASLNQVEEILWRLTLLSSEEGAFHVCDNAIPVCEEVLLGSALKFDLEESFVPNRRNILGAVQLHVVKPASFSIRVTSNYPELNLLVILREKNKILAIATCCGRGELFWSPVGLEAHVISFSGVSLRINGQQMYDRQANASTRGIKQAKKPTSGASSRKSGKSKLTSPVGPEPKVYEIEVTAPEGWPLTSAQWSKVDEVRNLPDIAMPVSAKRTKQTGIEDRQQPEALPGDASCRLEVSLAPESQVAVQRDNSRDLAWAAELASWERGARHARGALVRDHFRDKYLKPGETFEECLSKLKFQVVDTSENTMTMTSQQRLSNNMSSEMIIEERYLTKPDHLQDKFQSLEFVPLCMKEELPESVTLTPEAAEAAQAEMCLRIEMAQARGDELQDYNVHVVIAGQRRRNQLLDALFVDSNWRPRVAEALQARDEAGGSLPRRASSRSLRGKKK